MSAEAGYIVIDKFFRQHRAHIRFSGRIAYHARTAPQKGDRFIAGHLHSLHQAQRHKMTYVETVRRRIKSDIKSCLSVIYKVSDLIFIRDLGEQAAFFQFFVASHSVFSSTLFHYAPASSDRCILIPELLRAGG